MQHRPDPRDRGPEWARELREGVEPPCVSDSADPVCEGDEECRLEQQRCVNVDVFEVIRHDQIHYVIDQIPSAVQ